MKRVRKWEWTPFKNPARTDGAIFHHWRRATDDQKEYPFAKFNKQLNIVSYTINEYNTHLRTNQSKWSKAQTDHLFDLAKRFDLRFVVMADRWDRANFGTKTVEDLKERYYEVIGLLAKVRIDLNDCWTGFRLKCEQSFQNRLKARMATRKFISLTLNMNADARSKCESYWIERKKISKKSKCC